MDMEMNMEIKKEDLLAGIFGEKVIEETLNGKSGYEEISVKDLHPSEHNVFRVENDEAMEELVASIKEKGVLFPLLIRKRKDDKGYEILSGHRRHLAAMMASLEKVPCVIMDVNDEDRDIIIADSNLQRPYITMSEKAWSIRIKYDAIKRKTNGELLGDPGSPNLKVTANSLGDPGSPKGKSADVIAEQMGMNGRTINRYIRLTYLIKPLLEMIDEEMLAMKAGVQLSYLPEKIQEHVLAILETENIKLKEDQAIILKENLNEESTINDVLYILKPGLLSPKLPKKKLSIKISKDIKKMYFPRMMTDNQIDEILTELTKEWAERNNPEYDGYVGSDE